MASASVTINLLHFTPSDCVIHVGDTVTWTNSTGVAGNLFFAPVANGPPDAGHVANGGTFSYTFGVTGVYSMSFDPDGPGIPFTGSIEVI